MSIVIKDKLMHFLTLYDKLMWLVKNTETFYFQDFDLENKTYRIFNYRLASYTDFLHDCALECRGIMFEINKNQECVRLASRPMKKFFNINENPLVSSLDFSQVKDIYVKADGSLMSTFIHNGTVRLKSKGSLFSEQAIQAMDWLNTQAKFKDALYDLDNIGFTVNLEWCAPTNRIVLPYSHPHLKVLNARCRENGEYMPYEDLVRLFGDNVIERVEVSDYQEFIKQIPSMEGIEGFVIHFNDGLIVKAKTSWYLSLHHMRESVINPRRLFELILDEHVDDALALFYDHKDIIDNINKMQSTVDSIYNNMVKNVEDFYQSHKNLDRKHYALAAQEHFKHTMFFGLAMNKYLGKENNYKQFLKNKWRELGIADKVLETQE